MKDDEIDKLKFMITKFTHTSFVHCDRLFISQFMRFDRLLADDIRAENEAYEKFKGAN